MEANTDSSSRTYGGRARVGLIVPTTNTVNEAEWAQLACDGVSFHTARMPLHGAADGTPLTPDLRAAIEQLTPAGLDCIAYSCTAGSMINPPDSLPAAMASFAGVHCTSTAAAIVFALRALSVRSIAVATPYHDAVNVQWREFLTANDFEVTAVRGLGIGAGGPHEFTRMSKLTLREVDGHARSTFAKAPADALLLSCTDMPTLPLLPELEASLGVPVISSNTATLWHVLSLCGIRPQLPQAGRLLCQG